MTMIHEAIIVDQYGEPLKQPTKRELTPGFGRALESFSFTSEQNPDDLLTQQGYEIYDKVGRDPHVYGVMQIRRQAICARPRSIQPQSQKRIDRKKAEFVRWNLEEKLGASSPKKHTGISTDLTSWTQTIYDITQSYADGFVMLEHIWEQETSGPYAGYWTIAKIKPRDPDLFHFKQDGIYKKDNTWNLEGNKQPKFKYLHFAFDPDFGNPYGRSLFSKIFYYQKFKRHVLTWWMTFLEKFAMPGFVGKFPWDESKTNQDDIIGWLETAIDKIRSRVGVVLPDNAPLELLEASKSATDVYENFCQFVNREISKAILGNELLTGTSGQPYGSRSLAEVTTSLIHQAQLEADCRLIDDVITDQVCYPLIYFNFPGTDGVPRHVTDTSIKPDLNAMATRDKTLIEAGANVTQAYIREMYGYPEPQDEDELLGITAIPQEAESQKPI